MTLCLLIQILECCQWWNEVAQRIATLEFDRTRKSMSVIVKSKLRSNSLLVKVYHLLSYQNVFVVVFLALSMKKIL